MLWSRRFGEDPNPLPQDRLEFSEKLRSGFVIPSNGGLDASSNSGAIPVTVADFNSDASSRFSNGGGFGEGLFGQRVAVAAGETAFIPSKCIVGRVDCNIIVDLTLQKWRPPEGLSHGCRGRAIIRDDRHIERGARCYAGGRSVPG